MKRKQNKALKVLHDFTDKVIIERRDELIANNNKTKNDNDDDDDVGAKRKLALLDVLLQASIDDKPLTNLEIREEVDTFMFEGHDTTTSAIAFAMYNIAKHPEVQVKLVDEIKLIYGNDKNAPLTLTDLNSMNYLELVIKETLRLYPSVPFIGRKTMEDSKVSKY